MKAIVSVIGQDKKGIIAKVSNLLYKYDINIEDISQTIMQNKYFTMIMIVDIEASSLDIGGINTQLQELAKELCVDIRISHEDIYKSMHKL